MRHLPNKEQMRILTHLAHTLAILVSSYLAKLSDM